jgi:hypothetical protein
MNAWSFDMEMDARRHDQSGLFRQRPGGLQSDRASRRSRCAAEFECLVPAKQPVERTASSDHSFTQLKTW